MIGKVDMDRGSSLVEEALEKSEDESIRLFAQTTLGWKKEYFEKSNKTVEKR